MTKSYYFILLESQDSGSDSGLSEADSLLECCHLGLTGTERGCFQTHSRVLAGEASVPATPLLQLLAVLASLCTKLIWERQLALGGVTKIEARIVYKLVLVAFHHLC